MSDALSSNLTEQLARLPDLFGAHVFISFSALMTGVAISMPLAILVARREGLRGAVLGAVSVIQTVPSLALLALITLTLAPLTGMGFWPAYMALVLYSMLPIVRNTVAGITGVDADMIEAARGLGMTPRQQLVQVELPLALPVIMAGVRTASVWVIGIATLSTPVGQSSLGDYIFSGLQTRNWIAVLVGVVAAAVLALTVDGLIALLESAARLRHKGRAILAISVLAALFVGGLAPQIADGLKDRDGLVVVGSKAFTEQYILGDLLAGVLRQSDIQSEHRQSLGSTIVYDALRAGEVDVYVDYSGTIWANTMKRKDVLPPKETLAEMTAWLKKEHGVTCMGSLGFENAYALAMRRDRAEELGIRTIEDLARHASKLQMGSDLEFFSRPEWIRLRDTYGLAFDKQVNFDPTFMYQAVVDKQVDVITAFSSDGRIAAFDLLVLDDPRNAFPPYDAIVLLSPKAAADPRIEAALKPLIGAINDDEMRAANKMVDVDKKTVPQAAEALIKSSTAPDKTP